MVGRGNIKVGLFLRPQATPLEDPETKLVIAHIAFAVDGDKLEAARLALVASGVEVEGPDDSGIADAYFFKDPDGHELGLRLNQSQKAMAVASATPDRKLAASLS